MSKWLVAALFVRVLIGLAACDSAHSPPPPSAPVSKSEPAGSSGAGAIATPKTPDPVPPPTQENPAPPKAPPVDPPPPRKEALPTVQESALSGFVIDRQVRLKIADLTGRESEIHRLERVKIRGTRISIDDETFGRRLIIRPDLGLAWVIDRVDGTYSEVTFDAVAKRRAEVREELRSALRRVEGSSDAGSIADTLLRLGELPEGMPVSVRSTERSEKVLGRDAVGREIRIGEGISYINVLVDPALEGALGYFDALAKIGAFHPTVAERLKQLGGFPVRGQVRYALFLGLVKSDEEVIAAVRAEVPDADFDRPAGLTKIPLAGIDPLAWTPPAKPKNFTRSFAEDELDRDRNPFRQDDKK
jgi:hypothetical protein